MNLSLGFCVILPSFLWLQLVAVNGVVGGSVSLTVEGGGSLTGPQCPGNVTLHCEGDNLTFLRWRYNGGRDIHEQFNPDDEPSDIPLSGLPAFLRVTFNATPSIHDPIHADFTSNLTVNLEQLENVMNISCGDVSSITSIPVDVTLLQPSAPASPDITCIFAFYQSTSLSRSSVEVAWAKMVALNCSTFLHYELSVGTGLSQNISQADCRDSLCVAQFNNSDMVVTDISLRVVNDFGTSGNATYSLEQTSAQYFTLEVNITDNCETTLRCVPGTSLSGSSTCSVQVYTSDPTYRNMSDTVTGPLNMELQVQRLQPNTVYYFVFSVTVDEILTVSINASGACDAQMAEPGNIAAAVVVPIVIIGILCLILIIIVLKRKKPKEHTPVELPPAIAYEMEPVPTELPPEMLCDPETKSTDSSVRSEPTSREKAARELLLNTRIPATKLEKIAKLLHDRWLGLNLSQSACTPLDALKKWHNKEGENATYGALVEKLKSNGQEDTVGKICALAMGVIQCRSSNKKGSSTTMGKFWTHEIKTLKVHFMNPDLKVPWNKPDPDTILEWAAKGWNRENEKWPRISEKQCGLEGSHIRVKFLDSEQPETWSMVGADAMKVEGHEATMYLCLNTSSVEEQKSRVLHEFGHALGLEHEHEQSDVWEVLQKVCDNESLEVVSEDFSPTEESSAVAKRSYDPDSIMHFWMNIDWLKQEYRDLDNVKEMIDLSSQEKKVIEGVHKRDHTNGQLAKEPSEGDFEALRQVYGQPAAEIFQPVSDETTL